ncbi:response regulator [Brachybacterium vulturis]|uniref:response regulator n=1 Tax=Brachybacterium vulturis TaxID=2017484 RepID=UPI0037360C8D
MITVMIAEDQTMMRSALVSLLGLEPDLRVIGEVDRGDEVGAAVAARRPDVLLLDIELPGRSGLDVLEQVRAVRFATAVVIVTTFGRPGYLRRAMDAGARGFFVKDRPVEELADAIRTIAAGETVVDPSLAAQALRSGPSPLTDREREVLAAADGGAPITELAATLHLSPSTVRNYLSSAIGKTGARNRAEALRSAREAGWL